MNAATKPQKEVKSVSETREEEVFLYLEVHPNIHTVELAEDLKMSVIEADSILNALRDKFRAVESFELNRGYVWSAVLEECYLYNDRKYKKGAFGFVFCDIGNQWLRSSIDWDLIKSRGVQV